MDGLVQLQPVGPRLPAWLRKSGSHFASVHNLKTELRRLRLNTVCESARCPNLHECFHRGAATFMILGNRCTRGCGFCSVPKSRHPGPLDPEEPAHVARMAQAMGLRYVVITSVNRDDLADGGSQHFAQTVREVKRALPEARVETLTPDFCGDLDAVARVLDASPDVFNHNVETVPRLYRTVRPQADYRQSLAVLRFASEYYRPADQTCGAGLRPAGSSGDATPNPNRDREGAAAAPIKTGALIKASKHSPLAEQTCGAGLRPAGSSGDATPTPNRDREGAALVKSGAMLGLGETPAEVHQLLHDLRDAQVDVVTLGQYLQPARRNLPVAEYIAPERFASYRDYGLSLGFKMVFSGPLVRSSYMADLVREQASTL
jgi:lipoic acid synthetase